MAAKAPRPPTGADQNVSFSFELNGKTYTVRASEVTATMAAKHKAQHPGGASIMSMMVAAGDNMDLDVLASLVWIGRQQSGEDPTWDEVAESITYASDIQEVSEPDDEDPDSPEA